MCSYTKNSLFRKKLKLLESNFIYVVESLWYTSLKTKKFLKKPHFFHDFLNIEKINFHLLDHFFFLKKKI